MPPDRAQSLIEDINRDDYTTQPLSQISDFVDAVAAIAHRFSHELRRKNHKGRTAWNVLSGFCSPVHVEYLLNGPRGFAVRDLGDVALDIYGTTKVEADANETKSWFRNNRRVSARNATVKIKNKELMKTVAASTGIRFPKHLDQRDRIRTEFGGFRDAITSGSHLPGPRLNLRTVPYADRPQHLDPNAKTIRSRARHPAPNREEVHIWPDDTVE